MFQETRILFYHAVSPVHMGAGTAVGGLIDNPIQRERHTGHPLFAGSGLKGALRDHLKGRGWEEDWLARVFGPGTDKAHEHAGAIALTDAQLLLFPIRSLRQAFVYATSPTALARARRILAMAGTDPGWQLPQVAEGQALTASRRVLVDGQLVLEAFTFPAAEAEDLKAVGAWLAQNAFPAGAGGFSFFADKVKQDLVLLSDQDFTHFVETGTVVEPHVRINDATGTADEGGLFYTENLPPESVMIGALLASRARRNGDGTSAKEIAAELHEALDGELVQIGGDATTGRGQVVLRVVG